VAIIRKAPNGELVTFPDGTSEDEIAQTLYSDQYKDQNKGILADTPDALKNNWVFDTFAVAPYEGARKGINSAMSLTEDLGDTLGEKTTLGGFRYGKDAENGLVQYVPYEDAIKDLEQGKKTYGILSPITGAIGVKDAYNIKGFFYDPTNPDNNDHTEGAVANLVEGVTQFVVGFKGIDKLFKVAKVGKAQTTLGQFGQISAKGAGADFVAFDQNSGRLTDLLAEYAPETVDTYFGYLKSDPTDTWWEGRFKNALEGLGIGSLAEVAFRSARFAKAFKEDKLNTKVAKEDAEYLEKTNGTLEEVGNRLDEATTISEKMQLLNDALDAGDPLKFKISKKITPTQQIKIINESVKKGLSRNFEKWQKGDLTSEEAFNVPEGFINLETFKGQYNPKTKKFEGGLSFEGLKTFKLFYDAVSKVNKKLDKKITDEAVRRKAINDYGGDVNKVFQDFSKFADDVEGTSSLIFAHEVAYTSLLNAFPRFIRQYKMGSRSKADMQMMMFMLENMTTNAKRVRSASGRNLRIYNLTKDEFFQSKYIEEEFVNAKNAYLNFGGGEKAFDEFLERLSKSDNPTAGRKVINYALRNRLWNVANEVWINALLSSPKTQLVNAVSNGMMGLMRPLEDAIGNKVSELISFKDLEKAKTYNRGFNESIERYAGMVEYSGDALKYAVMAFRNGELVLQAKDAGASKLDTATEKAIKNKLVGNIVRYPSKFLNAGDEFFKQINYRAKLKSQAFREARKANITGKRNIKAYVDEYIRQGYDESGLRGVNEEAMKYAEENTFTNELVGFTDKFSDLVNTYPFLKQFFPFVKTPTNIAKAIADRTPLAFLYRHQDLFGRSGDPVAIAKARGQLAVGSIILTVAYQLAMQGKISGRTGVKGDEPIDVYKDAETLRLKKSALKFKPYSYRFDSGKQLPFGQLDPFGALFGIMADFVQIRDRMTEEEIERFGADMQMVMMSNDGKNPLDLGQKTQIFAGSAFEAVKRNVFSKTYLRALADIVEAFNTEDERKLERYMSQKIGSFVPNVVTKIVNDPFYRDATTIMEQVRNRTGFGTPSSPRYNALGEAHKDSDSVLTRFIRNAVNPLATTKLADDPIAKEIVRLGVGLRGFEKYNNLVEYPQYKKGKVSAFDRINQLLSTTSINGKTLRQALEAEIQLDSYKNMSEPIKVGKGISDDGGKVQRLKFIIEQYKQEAMREFEGEKKDFIFTENKNLSLKQAEKNQSDNKYEITRDRQINTKIKLKPLINFGNQ